jgi:hypothetical protein
LEFLKLEAPTVQSWVVLDDEDVTKGRPGEAMDRVRKRFVRTEGEVGLTVEDANRAVAILYYTE